MKYLRFKNLSSQPQHRLAYAMVPTAHVKDWPSSGVTKQQGWHWALGQRVGDQTRVWVRTQLDGGETKGIEFTPENFHLHDFDLPLPGLRSDWALDKPQDALLELQVTKDGETFTVPYGFVEVVESTALCQVFKLQVLGQGFYSSLYVTVAYGQDVFDYQGQVRWSDNRDARYALNNVTLKLKHGERTALYLGPPLMQRTDEDGNHVILQDATLPDAISVPFYGAVVAEKDFGDPEPLREAIATAAFEGPVVGLASRGVWTGHVGPHRASLPLDVPGLDRGVRADLSRWRNPWDSRQPWGQPKSTGTTGDQGVFGRMKALGVFMDGDPEALMALRWGNTEIGWRGCHHAENDGRPLTFDWGFDDPRTTYGIYKHYRASAGAWGAKSSRGPGWTDDYGGRFYMDPQHRGNLFPPAGLVLLGDYLMQEWLSDLLAADSRDVRIRQDRFDAPRAAGRKLQEWAWWWCGASEEQRLELNALIDNMVGIVGRTPKMNVMGPVKVLFAFSKSDGKNPLRAVSGQPWEGCDAWAPWEHSFVVDGLVACADLCRSEQDYARLAERLALALQIAHVVVDHGCFEPEPGVFINGSYVKWNAGGAANPPEYFNLNRDGVQTDLVARGSDLVIGGISVFWYSGAILTASATGSPKAERWIAAGRLVPHNHSSAEWVVGAPSLG